MSIKESYNSWSKVYDTNDNKTRDLEATALKETLTDLKFKNCLEIGCGTGKNTDFLLTKAEKVTGIDISEKMLEKAIEKIKSDKVIFLLKNITKNWNYNKNSYDFITFSLILEHIKNLDFIFRQIKNTITSNGYIYIGELHPFKQYTGSQAKFKTEDKTHLTTCFTHHISDFTQLAKKYNFKIVNINEFFDDNDRTNIPRIISILLQNQ